MSKRFAIKKTREKKRGQAGNITVYYVYDNLRNCQVTATSPFIGDAERLMDKFNELSKDE